MTLVVTNLVTTRQVVLLDLSSFSSSAECEFTVLVRSSLRYEALSTYTSQQRLVRSRLLLPIEVGQNTSSIDTIQEVELKVLPLPKLRFIYIVEVALKLLLRSQNPKTTALMTLSYSNHDES